MFAPYNGLVAGDRCRHRIAKMDDQDEEQNIIELVTWIEKVGHEGDALRNLGEHLVGHRKTCRRTGYNFARIDAEGVLEVCFWLPLTEIKKVFDIGDDDQELSDWLDAINANGIEASLVDDKQLGKCVLVKRLHYIPRDARGRWISPDTLPSSDYRALAHLLNLKNQQRYPDAANSPAGESPQPED
jgi:hypothetical protein